MDGSLPTTLRGFVERHFDVMVNDRGEALLIIGCYGPAQGRARLWLDGFGEEPALVKGDGMVIRLPDMAPSARAILTRTHRLHVVEMADTSVAAVYQASVMPQTVTRRLGVSPQRVGA